MFIQFTEEALLIDCPKVNNVEFDNFLLFSAPILSTGNNSVICQTKRDKKCMGKDLDLH